MSVCDGECSYDYRETTPFVDEMNINSSILTLEIVVPVNTTENVGINDLTITDENTGYECSIIAGSTLDSVRCRFPENSDGSPMLEAGTLEVNVWAEGTGYLPSSSNISPI